MSGIVPIGATSKAGWPEFTGPVAAPQTAKLTAKQIDAASVADLAAVIEADPSQKRTIERRLVNRGRSASVYELARLLDPRLKPGALAGKGEPSKPTGSASQAPAKPDGPGGTSGTSEPGGASPDTVPVDVEAILTALDAQTAERIEPILHRLYSRISRRVWNGISALFVSTIQSAGASNDDWFQSSDEDRREDRKREVSMAIVGDRLIFQSASGHGWSIDIAPDADESGQLAVLRAAASGRLPG